MKDPPRFNYLLSPVKTEVIIDFGTGLKKETRFYLDYRRIVHPPLNRDTTLPIGMKEYKLVLPLERPVLARLRIGENWDHIYLLPGISTYASLDPDQKNQMKVVVTGPKEVKSINQYYDARFQLLGVDREILQAYQKYNRINDPLIARNKYDSLSQSQLKLLDNYSSQLPDWFHALEKKEIKYSSEVFILSAIKQSVYKDLIAPPIDVIPFGLNRDLNDNLGLLTNFYVWSLGEMASLEFCEEDCFDDNLEIRIPALIEAKLKMAEEIEDTEIRQIFLAQNLMAIYHSNKSLSGSLMQEVEQNLEKPYLDMVRIYKNPSLNGQKATSFYLADETGKFYTLNDLKGKVVLLNFWFVGCKPCEIELPHERALVQKLQDEQFVLVNICTNTPAEAWKKFIVENEMPGINLYAKGNWGEKLSDAYQINGFPTYVLIDKNGIIALDEASRPSGKKLITEIRRIL